MDERKNEMNYKLGVIIGSALVVCLVLIMIAISLRIVYWILMPLF